METPKTTPNIQKPCDRLAKKQFLLRCGVLCLNTYKLLCCYKGKCLFYMIGKCRERPETKKKRNTSGTENHINMLVSRSKIAKSRLLIPINHRIGETKYDRAYSKTNISSMPELLLYKATNPIRYHLWGSCQWAKMF